MKPSPQCGVFGSGAFGRCLGPEGRALTNGISDVPRATPEKYLACPLCEGTTRRQSHMK